MTTPTGSLAYRKAEASIWAGTVPEKYTRLLPHIPTSRRLLEFGAAEGVLSLLLADRDPSADVLAVEQNAHRHVTAVELWARWRELGKRVDRCTMLEADIRERLDLFHGIETVVAIRTIYHLGDHLEDVFAGMAAAGVSTVVLGGNPNRATRAKDGGGDPFDFFAGVPGMTYALERAGYRIGTVVPASKGSDPVVVGHRQS